MKLPWMDALRLAVPPGCIALAVTLLRLAGERSGWSETWFSRVTAGLVPASAVSWVVGITWLALPFGVYFAWKLLATGNRPAATWRAVLFAVVAVLVLYLAPRLLLPPLRPTFHGYLVGVWSIAAVCAALAWTAWPSLARTLLCYGLLSRAPVVLVMLLAMHGRWGTHYDYADIPQFQQMPLWSGFLLLAFVPQLVFWVGFTIVAGMLAGMLTATLTRGAAREKRTLAAVALLGAGAIVAAGPGRALAQHAQTPLEAAASRVRARETAFAKTMADRDLAAFASFVAEEAVFVGGKSVFRGREAVVAGWKPLFAASKAPFSWRPEQVEVIDSGTLALSRGPVLDPDGKRAGTFSSTWRREKDGEWRVVLDSGCPPCPCP